MLSLRLFSCTVIRFPGSPQCVTSSFIFMWNQIAAEGLLCWLGGWVCGGGGGCARSLQARKTLLKRRHIPNIAALNTLRAAPGQRNVTNVCDFWGGRRRRTNTSAFIKYQNSTSAIRETSRTTRIT